VLAFVASGFIIPNAENRDIVPIGFGAVLAGCPVLTMAVTVMFVPCPKIMLVGFTLTVVVVGYTTSMVVLADVELA